MRCEKSGILSYYYWDDWSPVQEAEKHFGIEAIAIDDIFENITKKI